jgi:hypothetical protein
MSTSTDAHDPSVGDYADTSPAKLGRKSYLVSRNTLLSASRSISSCA